MKNTPFTKKTYSTGLGDEPIKILGLRIKFFIETVYGYISRYKRSE